MQNSADLAPFVPSAQRVSKKLHMYIEQHLACAAVTQSTLLPNPEPSERICRYTIHGSIGKVLFLSLSSSVRSSHTPELFCAALSTNEHAHVASERHILFWSLAIEGAEEGGWK